MRVLDFFRALFRPALPGMTRVSAPWFWRSEWQRCEREATRDLTTGHYADFRDIEGVIAALKSRNALEGEPDPIIAAVRREARGTEGA